MFQRHHLRSARQKRLGQQVQVRNTILVLLTEPGRVFFTFQSSMRERLILPAAWKVCFYMKPFPGTITRSLYSRKTLRFRSFAVLVATMPMLRDGRFTANRWGRSWGFIQI